MFYIVDLGKFKEIFKKFIITSSVNEYIKIIFSLGVYEYNFKNIIERILIRLIVIMKKVLTIFLSLHFHFQL